MKLIGTMPVRNEDWCLALSLRVALLWLDEIVVLLHDCTDESGEIVWQCIRENDRGRIHVLREHGEWFEMKHRQAMLEKARARGATHIAIVDADEVLTGNLLHDNILYVRRAIDAEGIADIRGTRPGELLQFPLYNLRGGLNRYHSNGIWGGKSTCLAFPDDPRLNWNMERLHHHRHPKGAPLTPYAPIKSGGGGIIHLWGASERRLRAKHALYKVRERLLLPGKAVVAIDREYSWAIHGDPQNPNHGTPENWTYTEVPAAWWAPYGKWLQHLHVDAVPWQEAEVQRLVAKHGREAFAGLDLFGVV